MKFFKKLIDISISLLSKKDKSIDKSLRKTEKSLKDIEKKEIITKKIVSK
ncbi:MAG: hypothetical protein KAX49_13675 [Halanaerobiales bacterium]|nr:hypothetical protein [Halanaerobiales bacterium]